MEFDINILIKAAKTGGSTVLKYFNQALEIEEKTTSADLRTVADTASEKAILDILKSNYPEVNVHAEESGETDNKSDYTFVIDPLDGTNNFVLGIPVFTVSIGLLKGSDSIMGVIYNPFLDQVYYAEESNGAYLNGDQIFVNNEANINKSSISFTKGYETSRENTDKIFSSLKDFGVKRILDQWCPAYDHCLLAAGRIEGAINIDGESVDYAAAKIIIKEAGGKITDFKGKEECGVNPNYIASNGTEVHNKLLEVFN